MQKTSILFIILIALVINALGQRPEFIRTKEGAPILDKKKLTISFLKSLNKDRSDTTALAICECEIKKLDWRFTKKQYKDHTKNGIINIDDLIKEDTVFEKEFEACYKNSGKTYLLEAEGFQDRFIKNCVTSIQKNTDKKLDTNQLLNFCSCQIDLIKTNKLTDAEFKTVNDPNSVLFFEIMYKCGDPFETKDRSDANWSKNQLKDVIGPESDTVSVLNINGMTYVKVKIGNELRIWLFDTGASDLLINADIEASLKKSNVITEANYMGIGEYEMANGTIDSCRRYKIDNIQIGKFKVSNIIVAVTDKGKRIIVGKGLLNKFSNWSLSNQANILILSK